MAMLCSKVFSSSSLTYLLHHLPTVTFPPTTFINLSLLSTSINNETPTGNPQPEISEFLLKECGLSQSDLSVLIRRNAPFRSIHLAREAVKLMRDSGFTEEQVRKTIYRYPVVLVRKTDQQLKPKIEIFKRLGITGEDLGSLISSGPRLLGSNIDKTLNTNIQYLQSLFGSPATVSRDLKRASRILVCRGGPEIWENKLRHLARFGLLEDEVKGLVRKYPMVLEISTDKMQKNMEFLMNTAQLPANIVLHYPLLFCYNVEGRLKIRLKVLRFISAMQPSNPLPNLANAFSMTNQKFLDKYVKSSPDATKLFEIYSGKSVHLDITFRSD